MHSGGILFWPHRPSEAAGLDGPSLLNPVSIERLIMRRGESSDDEDHEEANMIMIVS